MLDKMDQPMLLTSSKTDRTSGQDEVHFLSVIPTTRRPGIVRAGLAESRAEPEGTLPRRYSSTRQTVALWTIFLKRRDRQGPS